jgi:hypothetical protein
MAISRAKHPIALSTIGCTKKWISINIEIHFYDKKFGY